jgi:hypothetical protein
MKSLVIGSAVLAVVASIVSVAHAETIVRVRDSLAQMPQQSRAHKSMSMTKNDAVVDGRVVGRDPNANIRASLAAEHYNRNASGGEGGGEGGAAE